MCTHPWDVRQRPVAQKEEFISRAHSMAGVSICCLFFSPQFVESPCADPFLFSLLSSLSDGIYFANNPPRDGQVCRQARTAKAATSKAYRTCWGIGYKNEEKQYQSLYNTQRRDEMPQLQKFWEGWICSSQAMDGNRWPGNWIELCQECWTFLRDRGTFAWPMQRHYYCYPANRSREPR